jgi:hypothetical protein
VYELDTVYFELKGNKNSEYTVIQKLVSKYIRRHDFLHKMQSEINLHKYHVEQNYEGKV